MDRRQRRKQRLRRLEYGSIGLITLGVILIEVSRPLAVVLLWTGAVSIGILYVAHIIHWVLSLFSR